MSVAPSSITCATVAASRPVSPRRPARHQPPSRRSNLYPLLHRGRGGGQEVGGRRGGGGGGGAAAPRRALAPPPPPLPPPPFGPHLLPQCRRRVFCLPVN